MLVKRYLKYLAAFFTTLLVSEQIPLVKTIGPGPSETSQLLSAMSEFANGAKESIVEIVTRPSDFFHRNENNQSPIDHELSPLPPTPPPLEVPPESLSESLQPPEPMPMEDHTPRFLRVDGSKVTIELDLEKVPGFYTTRKVVVWMAHWFGALFSGGMVGHPYWLYIFVPAALGFFGGLGYGFVGWCRWCLSRPRPPRAVERAVAPKQPERRAPANSYCECFL